MDTFSFIERVHTLTDGRAPQFFIRTYGCQMNVRESEKLAGTLVLMGYERAAREEDSDLILYNTCCVRESAENKILGNLGRAKFRKETNPRLTVVVCGCMAKQSSTLAVLMEQHIYVDLIFGTHNRHRFPELLYKHFETGLRVVDTIDENLSESESVLDGAALTAQRNFPYRAGVNIMYGCDNFCAYCVVPFVRGRERSREPDDVLREVSALVGDGVREIMLLGQNVNAYGKKPVAGPLSFAELLYRVNEVPGLERIRFMTSHPKDFSPELIEAIRRCEKVCKAVHLPIQSGSTRILSAMNRQYTKESYLHLAERLLSSVPGVGLSTDIIVGFPGETEEDFMDTLDVARRVRFAGAFTFLYSKRSGTPAAARSDKVPPEVMRERFRRLLEVVNPLILARNETRVGETPAVMAEDGKPGKNGTQTGRADDNTLVHFTGEKARPGDIVPVKIIEAKTFYITGERI